MTESIFSDIDVGFSIGCEPILEKRVAMVLSRSTSFIISSAVSIITSGKSLLIFSSSNQASRLDIGVPSW